MSSSLTTEDKAAIRWAQAILHAQFPGLSPQGLAQIYAGETVELPDFILKEKALSHAIVSVAASTYVGAATFCYGRDPETGELSLVMIRRRETDANGEHHYGILGGFARPGYYEYDKGTIIAHPGEQPWQAAIRENREELLDDTGKPIINLDQSRLVLLDNGIDERSLGKGMLPVSYCGFAVALTDEEMLAVHTHAKRMKNDETYRKAVIEKAEGEVAAIEIVPLEKAATLLPEQFTHPHELLGGIHRLYEALTAAPLNNPRAALVQRAFANAQQLVA